MKHLLLTTDFKPHVGGVAEYLHGLASALHGRDRPVEVVATRVGASEDFAPAYPVRYLNGIRRHVGERTGDRWPVVRKLNSLLCHLRRCRRGRRTVRRLLDTREDEPASVCIGVWDSTAHGWCEELRARGVPYRLFAYGREVVDRADLLRRRWREMDFRSAETVYACSTATARLIQETFPGVQPRVVWPGITGPGDAAAIEETAGALARGFGIGHRTRVLVTVGRLVRRKGVHAVLEALASSELLSDRVHYLVAGSGPEEERLREVARELDLESRVDFLGHVDERTKWAVYRLGDVFVMPNSDLGGRDWEGFGIVFLEAAVMGLPAVAGRSGGAVDAIEDGETGRLVDPGSARELVEALERLVADARLRRRLGVRARRRARDEFTWERAVDRLVGFAPTSRGEGSRTGG